MRQTVLIQAQLVHRFAVHETTHAEPFTGCVDTARQVVNIRLLAFWVDAFLFETLELVASLELFQMALLS